jgi:hypothetical protein
MEPSKPSGTPNTPFTAIYAQWLDSFKALFPGSAAPEKAGELTPRQEQVVATQEWEDEGGSVKPVPTPEAKDAPKIPF